MAKSYFSVRDVKNGFDEILNDNEKALSELQGAVKSVATDKAGLQETYQRGLDRYIGGLIHPMDGAALKKISYWMPRSGDDGFAARDLETEYRSRVTASQMAEIKLNGLTATNGSLTQMTKTVEGLNTQITELTGEISGIRDSIDAYDAKLAPVAAYNSRAEKQGKPQLTAGEIDYFSSKKGFSHVFSYLFDSHYRQGRGLIKSFTGRESIPEAQQTFADQKTAYAAKREEKETIIEKRDTAQGVLTEMQQTDAAVFSEQKLREDLKKEVLIAMEDAGRFGKIAKSLEDSFPQLLLEQRAKIEQFAQLQNGAEQTIRTVHDANKKLSVHMPKLKKAVSRQPSKKISIDLDGIRQSFKPLQKGVKAQAARVQQRSTAVSKYRYQPVPAASGSTQAAGGIDALDIVMIAMILDMSNDMPSVPDVDVGGSFNDAVSGIDSASFDIPDISKMDISVPDISVPDISIDTGSFSDFGSSFGGFDGF
jgi:hypothetical protein